MKQSKFVITQVSACGPQRLALAFEDGYAAVVDLAGTVKKYPSLARLMDRKVFATVAPDDCALGVIFANDDDLTLASDNLRALALEQAGEYSHQSVIAWMHHNNLTLDAAAQALGISRRMLAYYRRGEKTVPKTVGLAMLGWDTLQKRKAA
ncbi:hypothetical protein [Achromobacter aloeverae]|uniref:DUF2442 domain-containing protein n=1 Tax=Achromobacter aloeverae TaxID=1750518 RepID=A0A4Q1HKX5_9BURK|nr:hypothetical protein [Achromobacter aloeverae]RXN90543.1 hypothetical protein C7R54_13750 [Achromobacter aloeverae]